MLCTTISCGWITVFFFVGPPAGLCGPNSWIVRARQLIPTQLRSVHTTQSPCTVTSAPPSQCTSGASTDSPYIDSSRRSRSLV